MNTKAFVVTSLVAATGTAAIAFGQWSLPFALAPVTVDQDKNVTINFDNAPVSKVFEWMKGAGIDFVVETSDIPKGKTLTVHLTGQPKEQAVEAIAEALGMGFTKKGDIYTLRPGLGGAFVWSGDQALKGEAAEKWAKEFSEKFGKEWKFEGPDSKTWKEFGKQFENFPKDFQKWKELHPDMKFEFKEMPPEAKQELEQHLKGLHDMKLELKGLPTESMKELEEHLKGLPDMKLEMKEMSPEAMKELQEHLKGLEHLKLRELPEMEQLMKERMKGLDKLKELEKLDPKIREHMLELPKIEAKALKSHMEAMKKLKDMKMPDMSKIEKGLANIEKLVKSFTPEQLEKNKKQGYLTIDDLTPAQREMLGDWGKGEDVHFQFENDGTKIVIKRK